MVEVYGALGVELTGDNIAVKLSTGEPPASNEVAEDLRQRGLNAESFDGGYIAWIMDIMSEPQEQSKAKDVEQSLRKKFKKTIWSRFTKAINTYELVKAGRSDSSLYFRRERLHAYGKMLSGAKTT